jgi:hypothetical protein
MAQQPKARRAQHFLGLDAVTCATWVPGLRQICLAKYTGWPMHSCGFIMSLTRLECRVSKVVNSDACPRPTTRRGVDPGGRA